ncbi:MAG: hypothetical protein QOH05_3228 [Acetobacteraceae bacterium]|nr:hypothetical protein [Acetobacteraceae bacterium]
MSSRPIRAKFIRLESRISEERFRDLPMNTARFTLILAAAAGFACSGARAATEPKSIAEFCRANPNVDFPDHAFYGPRYKAGILPREVAAVEATNWRCNDGKVFVCAGGAAGSACSKMNPSREPSQAIRETCEDNPGQDFVATAVIGNSASTWRCQDSTAKIIATVPLDSRGFMVPTWAPLFDARGKLNTGIELGADPR